MHTRVRLSVTQQESRFRLRLRAHAFPFDSGLRRKRICKASSGSIDACVFNRSILGRAPVRGLKRTGLDDFFLGQRQCNRKLRSDGSDLDMNRSNQSNRLEAIAAAYEASEQGFNLIAREKRCQGLLTTASTPLPTVVRRVVLSVR